MLDRGPARAGDETQPGRAIMEFNGQWDLRRIRDDYGGRERHPLECATAIGSQPENPAGMVLVRKHAHSAPGA